MKTRDEKYTDYKSSILSQFKNSKTLVKILDGFFNMMTVGTTEILSNIADVDYASGTFLDNIGAIVGASRYISLDLSTATSDFGFDSEDFFGFDNPYGGTFDIKSSSSGLYILNDTAFRILIKMTAFRNITNCSIGNLNYLLSILFFERGTGWAVLTGAMEITLKFNFILEDYERNLILNGYFPAPAGYTIKIQEGA